jgi:uncharacterized protein
MSIPEFPEFRAVDLDVRDPLRAAFRALRPEVSEFSFANLFLFRRAHGYRVSRLGPMLLITGQGYDGRPYAFPPLGEGPADEAALRLCDQLASSGLEPALFPVPSSQLERTFHAGRWRASAERDQFDYVYSREELATLPGSKFHKRRNRLAKFLREEARDYEYAPLGPEHLERCMALSAHWCEIRCSPERPSTYDETQAAQEALQHREALGLVGGVVSLAGEVAAFCLGEELNPETFVVHFEKCQTGREGLAQLINRDFCLYGLPEYRYVNREQDLGDPGLRQAKEQYNPLFLVEKYRVVPA